MPDRLGKYLLQSAQIRSMVSSADVSISKVLDTGGKSDSGHFSLICIGAYSEVPR